MILIKELLQNEKKKIAAYVGTVIIHHHSIPDGGSDLGIIATKWWLTYHWAYH